jgi:hypothetical protein
MLPEFESSADRAVAWPFGEPMFLSPSRHDDDDYGDEEVEEDTSVSGVEDPDDAFDDPDEVDLDEDEEDLDDLDEDDDDEDIDDDPMTSTTMTWMKRTTTSTTWTTRTKTTSMRTKWSSTTRRMTSGVCGCSACGG